MQPLPPNPALQTRTPGQLLAKLRNTGRRVYALGSELRVQDGDKLSPRVQAAIREHKLGLVWLCRLEADMRRALEAGEHRTFRELLPAYEAIWDGEVLMTVLPGKAARPDSPEAPSPRQTALL